MIKKITTTLILTCVVGFIAQSQSVDTLARLDKLFSRWNNATPGVAVAIKRGDKIIYNKAFGLADLEHNVPNTTETIFESGSVAKQFAATAILMLADQGKINLNDDVRKYVPELPVYEAPITIQHLLNHTSGLKDWGSVGALTGWPRTTRVYTQDLALHIICKQKTLNFTPGKQYSYSNSNYTLLVTIVERISRTTLARYTDSVFFKPLQMTHTQWRDNFREVVPNRAIAYSGSPGNYQQLMPFEHVHGHGGLLTTTGDLLKWNSLLEPNSIFGSRVANWRVMTGTLNDGSKITYASGLRVQQYNGFDEIWHSGSTAGYRAWLGYFPQKKLSVAVLSNDASLGNLASQIVAAFFGEEKSIQKFKAPSEFISLTEAEKQNWAGTYKGTAEAIEVISLEYKNGKLVSNDEEILAIHRDTLYHDKVFWIRTGPSEITLKTPTQSGIYAKVAVPESSASTLQQLGGNYHSDDAEVDYEIYLANNALYKKVVSYPAEKLTPVYLNGFRDEDFTFYEFKRDKKGKVTGIEVSTLRALKVPFVKIK